MTPRRPQVPSGPELGPERFFHAPTAVFLCSLFAMRVASSVTAGACYLLLCAYALLGEKHVVRALALSWLVTVWNPSLGPSPLGGTAGRFLVIGVGALSCLIRWRGLRGVMVVSRPVLLAASLGLFFIVHSVVFSRQVEVSVLKAVVWMLTIVTLVCAWGRIGGELRSTAPRELRSLLLFVLVASTPFFWTRHGYLRNASGFQGMMNHPQAFGPTMALLASIILTEVLTRARPELWRLAALSLSLAFIVASEARTAAFALLLGIVFGFLFQIGGGVRQNLATFSGLRSRRVLGSVGVGLLLGMTQAPRAVAGLRGFLEKRGHSEGGVFAAYQESRGRLIAEMWEGFLRHPIMGNGFGLPSLSAHFEIVYDATTGLPAAAPVEKGVIPLAVLEDVGMIGAILVGLWLWDAARRARSVSLVSLTLLLTALATNLGEATLFSPGGMGLLIMNCLAWGASFRLQESVDP